MRNPHLYLIFSFLFIISCNKDENESFDLIITNATIIDVENDGIIEGQSIFIKDDIISKIEDYNQNTKYTAANTIDATGKFVMPGLWDMHVHFRGGDSLVEENKNMLPLFLAYGVTHVRDAGGDITPEVLSWRSEIENAQLDGPKIFTPGPKLDGDQPAWPGSIKVLNENDISKALDSLESLDVDFVKMYDGNLTKEAYYQIIKEADKRGLKTTGHMPLSANFMDAISYGLDGAEHMYYPLTACSPIGDSLIQLNKGYGIMEQLIDTYDSNLAKEVYKTMAENEVYITPTLHIGKTLSQILEVDHAQDSLLPYIGSGIQKTYQGRIEGAKRAKNSGSAMREKMEDISSKMISPMQQAGVRILAGSDCGAFNSYVYPGESLINELFMLTKAGLTPSEALATSIINGPAFFDLQEQYGSISKGKNAHVLILDKNPLENIENINSVFTVITTGKIYDKAKLNAMLSDIKN